MRTRVLPREEWGRLDVTKLPAFWNYVRPEEIEVVVVEDGDQIVGCATVMRAVCIEGVWIGRRNAAVGRMLRSAVMSSARRWSDLWAFGTIAQDKVRRIASWVGGKRLPVEVYMVPLAKEEGEARCA